MFVIIVGASGPGVRSLQKIAQWDIDGSVEKDVMVGRVISKQKRGKSSMRWIDVREGNHLRVYREESEGVRAWRKDVIDTTLGSFTN